MDTLTTENFPNQRIYENYLTAINYDAFKELSKEEANKIVDYAKDLKTGSGNKMITLFNENKYVGSQQKKQEEDQNKEKTVAEKVKLLMEIANPKQNPKQKSKLGPILNKNIQKREQAKEELQDKHTEEKNTKTPGWSTINKAYASTRPRPRNPK